MDEMELLRRFYADGDRKWLGILLERYTVLLFGVCMKYLKNTENAKDAVQQVFCKALAEIPRSDIKNMGGWLYTVARNECLGMLRGRKNFVAADLESREQEAALPLAELLLEDRRAAELKSAIQKLRTEQRECIVLFYFEKKNYQQIAAALQDTVKQVKSNIQNGKRNLKIILEAAYTTDLKEDRDEHTA